MTIESVGFIGWRGMVGSVLLERMRAEGDFEGLSPVFYSTSQVGDPAPTVGVPAPPLADAYDTTTLANHEAIVSCQGGDYTKQMLPKLRASGWQGYWIDAASAIRMDEDTVLVLDPLNRGAIDRGIDSGLKNFAGANCTVGLMLLGLHGLFAQGWVEWLTSMTYQAASGAGAKQMRELIAQMRVLGESSAEILADPGSAILDLDRSVSAALASDAFPTEKLGVPLAGSLIPWINSKMPGGETREEWKGHVEANKILETTADSPLSVDGLCVRVGAMRSHSQAVTVKLKRDIPLDEIESALAEANSWVEFVPNDKDATLAKLSPAYTSGTMRIPVGRVRKLRMGGEYLTAFTVGDQLLWGAAEPLRRVLAILRGQL
jgi:aspartate-semialdehyde dehydrogenase